jgi:lipopolysaccharide/colanic/teichoic acid biosynthesis glycosyltransferase
MDIAFAGVGLVLASPIMAAIAIVLRLNQGAPVIFRQPRAGYHCAIFTVFKFRTMADVCRPDGTIDQEVTRLGQFLRSYSLDELPQLWNVLTGDMSFVGPRPLLVEYLPLYSKEQARRHDVVPGITGWAQVNGRNAIGWDQKLAYDIWYVDHRSLKLDLRILWLTVLGILKRSGIDHGSGTTMPRFTGSEPPQ